MARAAAGKNGGGRTSASPSFERVALLLQGGGALGAYQGGVYQALDEAKVLPTWIAGISIGAVNSAIIAGNAPENRVARLRQFWETVSSSPLAVFGTPFRAAIDLKDNQTHRVINQLQALRIAMLGAPAFFTPRFPPPSPWAPQDPKNLSFYDVSPLHATLERLVDFDRINSGEIRFSVGATNVKTGDFARFDNSTHKIETRHIVASGSLPPGFPATEIAGEYYWDGGLVSNTPLQWVLESAASKDTLAFQVDLWCSSGEPPHDLTQADVRQKEIQFASRTRFVTDRFRKQQRLRHALRHMFERLPPSVREAPDVKTLSQEADESAYNVVELIYHSKSYEGIAKDYEFSRLTMDEHWRTGYEDAARALAHPEIFQRPDNLERFQAFDFSSET